MWPQAGPGTRKALAHAVSLLRSDGAKVEVIELPSEFAPLPEWYDIVLAWEGGVSFLSELRANPKHLSKPLADLAETRGGYSQLDYRKAVDGIMALRPCMDRFLGNFHAVLTPSAPDEAPQGFATGSYAFCKIWSAMQGPVLHVPGFCGKSRMPIGLSLVAPRYMDAQLLAVGAPVGALFEAKGGWTRSVHQEQSVKLVGEGNGHREASNGLWIKGKL
ncbi:hypothetical protein NLG97_g9546 [Lecanicillium saksenae]|uniref:Uncharacterized protein n=1 Tax=Lecanicillium saksenae TaxID=468837 RepID=A0ACC1QIF4_9HYPO|nr:hypothetical protein NLG97_g9546 [Lecanicillium saksenae]